MRLLIAEDSAAFLEVLLAFLAKVPGTAVVGRARRVSELPALLNSTPADVLLLDVGLVDGSSLPLLRDGRIPGQLATVVMTSHPSPELEQEALRHGARLFIDKETGIPRLVAYLRGMSPADAPVSSR